MTENTPSDAMVDPVGEWLQVCTDGRVSSHTITMLNAFRRWYDDQAAASVIADALAERDAEIARLNSAIKSQAAAVRTLQANEQTEINMLRAKAREAHAAIATLDSEREANARLTDELAERDARIRVLEDALRNPPKHHYWGAGEPDCPSAIKAGNGELHTLRCKVCGTDNPLHPICFAGVRELVDEA